MAHVRKRYIRAPFQELLRFSPLVGVLGHRQVGKTTFLEGETHHYLTFDDRDVLLAAQKDPKRFISNLKQGGVLDESQLVPEIFSALKEKVRTNKRPGQVILSGSVRFTSKKSIRESLTGRIQYLELLPLTLSELDGDPLSNKLEFLFENMDPERLLEHFSEPIGLIRNQTKKVETYRTHGGLPGVCFIRKESLRNAKILDQLRTILDRDLRQIHPTSLSFDALFAYLSELALQEGAPYRYQAYKDKLGINPLTQQKLLYALESIFLIRRLPIEGDSKSFIVLLEDQAESHYLSEGRLSEGTQLTGMLYRNLRAEVFYRIGSQIAAFQFRNRSGSYIPLVFRKEQSFVGFLYAEGGIVDRKLKGAAGTFEGVPEL